MNAHLRRALLDLRNAESDREAPAPEPQEVPEPKTSVSLFGPAAEAEKSAEKSDTPSSNKES